MNRIKEYIFEYCKICLGIESVPRGLDHNTDFQEFSKKTRPASVLLGYEEKSNSFIISSESLSLDCWILVTKGEGDLAKMDLSSSVDLFLSSDINEIKEMLTDQLKQSMEVNSLTHDSVESRMLNTVKVDLLKNPKYIKAIKGGNISAINTFEDEYVVQSQISLLERVPEAEYFSKILFNLIPYTRPGQQLNSSQIDTSIDEIMKAFRGLMEPAKGPPFSRERLKNLIAIYADTLYKEAQQENNSLDMFEYDNCNLRLKLSMWRDILKRYEEESRLVAQKHHVELGGSFGYYTEYIKKLSSAKYLRGRRRTDIGIYDELIRFCKYHQLVDCDRKLLIFNERRKTDQMTAKVERDFFFKEFNK